ncbi:MAG: reactive intermediate/imine deaminase [Streptococcus pyogenes]|uniref:RidA family protein n=1 Tax=Streptococcus halichoeri TaxID=254785 RepID=UPI000DB199E3|nr:Rid family detoxifying hydrolase [Streptococcus halichoeri]PZO94183.1 MAG: reactive intermediate/imine deaminase [Streptococcus pyogenes]
MNTIPKRVGPYSIYTIEGNILYTSGQLPICPESGTLETGFEAQCRRAFSNIANVLKSEDLSLDAIFKLTIYLADLAHFDELNRIMETLFEEPYPIRTAYQVASLPRNALIEIEAMARLTKTL